MRTFLPFCFAAIIGCGKDSDSSPNSPGKDVDRGASLGADSGELGSPSSDTAEATDSGSVGGAGVDGSDAIGDTLATAALLRSWESWGESVPLALDAIDHENDRDLYKMFIPPDGIAFISAHSFGLADLKLRVVDSSGSTMGVSRMMPHRVRGDDPGVWVQARGPQPMFVEVSAEEGSVYPSAYELVGIPVIGEDGEPNDSSADASARLSDGSAGFRSSIVGESGHTEFLGLIGASGDTDHWAFDAPSDGLMAWSLWPVASTVMDARMALTDASGAEIGWADDPDYLGVGSWFDDVGLLVPVQSGQRYTLSVTNDRPAFGAGTLYVGVATMLASLAQESEPNDDPLYASAVGLDESTVHPGYRTGATYGQLNATDALDVFRLSMSEPAYISVHVQAGTVGSGVQVRVTAWADPYGADVLGEASVDAGGDASLRDVWVAGTEAYVRIEAVSRREENSGNHYAVGFEAYPVPLHD